MNLTNTGQVALSELRGACGAPSVALFVEGDEREVYKSETTEDYKVQTVENCLLPSEPTIIKLKDGALQPGESIQVPILVRGDSVGAHTLKWLFSFHGVVCRLLHIIRWCSELTARRAG